MSVLAIIPARSGSKGIPGKNTRELAGESPLSRAIWCASQVVPNVVVISDCPTPWGGRAAHMNVQLMRRPPEISQDDTPMIAVVQHVLAQIPGPPDQQIVLLQPTQPLRKPEHITQALALLTPEVDSVVSVVETTSIDELLGVTQQRGLDELHRLAQSTWYLAGIPPRRQALRKSYKRDGTVYAFWRKTVGLQPQYGIYGLFSRPLIIPADDTCPLDTPADWLEAERRLRERAKP